MDQRTPMETQRGFEYGVKHILAPQAGTFLSLFPEILGVTLKSCQELLKFGAVYLKNQRQTQDFNLEIQDYVRVHTKPRRFRRAVPWSDHILWQDHRWVVIDKPAGLPCHASVDNLYENCLHQLSEYLNQKLFITHRLDVATSGVLIFAKTKDAQSLFNQILASDQIEKIYQAQVSPRHNAEQLSCGLKTHYMEISPRAPKKVKAEQDPQSLICQLEILEIMDLKLNPASPANSAHSRLVKIKLLTGRTHQIRAQMAFMGWPICGDISYGAEPLLTDRNEWDEIALTCASMAWTDPETHNLLKFQAKQKTIF